MRPVGFYTVFDLGRIIAITEGVKDARKLSPHRGYKRHATRLEAEEFTAWWNYRHDYQGSVNRRS